jgi:hypothetical protein
MVLHLVLFMFSYVSSDFLHGIICVDCFNIIRFIPVSTRSRNIGTPATVNVLVIRRHREKATHFRAYFLINEPRFYGQQQLTPNRNILRYRARENSRVFDEK